MLSTIEQKHNNITSSNALVDFNEFEIEYVLSNKKLPPALAYKINKDGKSGIYEFTEILDIHNSLNTGDFHEQNAYCEELQDKINHSLASEMCIFANNFGLFWYEYLIGNRQMFMDEINELENKIPAFKNALEMSLVLVITHWRKKHMAIRREMDRCLASGLRIANDTLKVLNILLTDAERMLSKYESEYSKAYGKKVKAITSLPSHLLKKGFSAAESNIDDA